MQGLVIKSTGSWYTVKGDDGLMYQCRIIGKFRIKDIKTTNPIAVGDVVTIEKETDNDTALITALQPRKNYIIRKSINLSKQAQIIGANLDQAFLIVTLAAPRTSLGFIDRFLVTAEAYSIPTKLIFNKVDLFDDTDRVYLEHVKALYERIGYPCYEASATEGLHIHKLEELLKDKITLFSGHSGVGKSTLINRLLPGIDIKTGEISDWSSKGQHTTTFAEMHPLPNGGYLIDSPGIRELGVIDIEKEELGHYFPEIFKESEFCRFNNCKHMQEPGCAVLKAVEEERIPISRYNSYESIYHGHDTRA